MRRSSEALLTFSGRAILAAVALSSLPALIAQAKTTTTWSVAMISTIKPECRADYEAAQKQVSAAYKKCEIPYRSVNQTVTGSLYEYISVVPMSHFADFDDPVSPMERALGKDAAALLSAKLSSYTTSLHRVISAADSDTSIHTPLHGGGYVSLNYMHIFPGKEGEFDAWLKNDYFPVIKKAEVKNFWVLRTVSGGDADERILVRPFNNMAELDSGPIMAKVLGEDGARHLRAKVAGVVDSVHASILRYRPDLSYDLRTPEPQTTASAK